MRIIVYMVLCALLGWGVYSIWRFVSWCINPRLWFLEFEKAPCRENAEYTGYVHPLTIREYHNYAVLLSAALGIGVLLAGGCYAFLFLLPASWGFVNEDGDWTSYRSIISKLAGLVTGFVLTYYVGERISDSYKRSFSDQVEKGVLRTKLQFARMNTSSATKEIERLKHKLKELRECADNRLLYSLAEENHVELEVTRQLVSCSDELLRLAHVELPELVYLRQHCSALRRQLSDVESALEQEQRRTKLDWSPERVRRKLEARKRRLDSP